MFDLKPDEARLLLDVAMMATGRNRFVSAAKILAALGRFRPGNPSLGAANAMLFIVLKRDLETVLHRAGRIDERDVNLVRMDVRAVPAPIAVCSELINRIEPVWY